MLALSSIKMLLLDMLLPPCACHAVLEISVEWTWCGGLCYRGSGERVLCVWDAAGVSENKHKQTL